MEIKDLKNFSGGGILPYSTFQGKNYFLIGKEKNGQFDDFGGSRDKEDKFPYICSIREYCEESHQILWKENELIEMIKDRDPTLYEFNYSQWILKYTPFIDEIKLNNTLKTSQKNITQEIKLEKTKVKWIEICLLQQLIQKFIQQGSKYSKNGLKFNNEIYLRKHFVKMMEKAERNGILEIIKNDI